ncbi:MAG: site-2 protease family protein [Alphaproteobacteria bacterium]|nr:site-2 protease family protein [Alphaproteobacteria bacterium]
METFLFAISVWALPVVLAITLHEAAHGFIASKLGDHTALMLGRVTFNPLRHIDPWGTVIIPAVLLITTSFVFGWAKPVPVDPRNLRNPRRDMVWVAAAGPGINLAMAIVAALLVHLALMVPGSTGDWLIANLRNAILVNLVLAVFNMMPIPPLDGGRVAVGVLPRALAYPLARLEPLGLYIVIALFFLLPWLGQTLGVRIDLFGLLVERPVAFLVDVVVRITGLR